MATIESSYVKSLTVEILKQELKKRNLVTKGKKADLRRRLITAIATDEKTITQTNNDRNLDVVNMENMENKELVCKFDFEMLIEEFTDFKKYAIENINRMNEQTENNIKDIKHENSFLKEELKNKQAIIDLLMTDLHSRSKIQPKRNEKNGIKTQQWQQVPTMNTATTTMQNKNPPINQFMGQSINQNQYHVLDIEPNHEVLVDTGRANKHQFILEKTSQTKSNKRNGIVIDPFPERNIPVQRTLPGNKKYSDVVKNGKKITVFGDSIIKRINGKELTRHLNKGRAFIKSFPGANAKDLAHYVIPTLIDQSPDAVVIHVGTNNVKRGNQKPTQTNAEIAEEIIQTGRICRQYGVNEVFISSLLCRSSTSEMKNIREINCFIKERCVRENFIFIFNDSISEEHLWKDGLHLTDDGTTILANNFINILNESSL